MKCNMCGVEISDDAKFCKSCGSPVEQKAQEKEPKKENTSSDKACPSCQTANKIDAHFCKSCGYSFDGKRPVTPAYVGVNAQILAERKANSYAKADKVFKILSIVFAACLAFFSLTFFLSAGFAEATDASLFDRYINIFSVLVGSIDGISEGVRNLSGATMEWATIYSNDIFNNLLLTLIIIGALVAMITLIIFAIVRFANLNKHPDKGVGVFPVYMYLLLLGTVYLIQAIGGNSYTNYSTDVSSLNISVSTSVGMSFCGFFFVLYVGCRLFLMHGEYKVGGVVNGKRVAGVICTVIGLFIGTSLLGAFGEHIYDIVATSSSTTNTSIDVGFYGVFNIIRGLNLTEYNTAADMATYASWNMAGSVLTIALIVLAVLSIGSVFQILDEGKGLKKSLILTIATASMALVYLIVLHLATDSLIAALALAYSNDTTNIGVFVFVDAVLMVVMVAVAVVLSMTEERDLVQAN